MDTNQSLNKKQQSIIPIAAFTASGNLDKLKLALEDGLAAGLTVNEIKEILVHLYAYAGFPRSLNGIHTFMALLDERQSRGIEDETGPEASPLPADMDRDEYGAEVRAKLAGWEKIPPPAGYQTFAPIIDTFLKEHLFADIFARDVLDFQSRELATISALASMAGTGGQLFFHLGTASAWRCRAATSPVLTATATRVGTLSQKRQTNTNRRSTASSTMPPIRLT